MLNIRILYLSFSWLNLSSCVNTCCTVVTRVQRLRAITLLHKLNYYFVSLASNFWPRNFKFRIKRKITHFVFIRFCVRFDSLATTVVVESIFLLSNNSNRLFDNSQMTQVDEWLCCKRLHVMCTLLFRSDCVVAVLGHWELIKMCHTDGQIHNVSQAQESISIVLFARLAS